MPGPPWCAGEARLHLVDLEVEYRLPLAEIITDFFDQFKSRGYASLDYEQIGYQAGTLVRVDVLLNGEPVDTFSSIVPKEQAYRYGRQMTEKLAPS